MEKMIEKLSETLSVDFKKLKSHYEKDFQFIDYTPSYFRFKRALGSVEEGTVAFLAEKGVEIIKGYPKIPRALVIETAFKKNFKEAYVEEKLNGYNVRSAVVDGELQAITRKGLVCEYTSLRIENELNMNFFKDYPDFVDAYVISACYEDGTDLTDEELDIFNEECFDLVYEEVISRVFGG